LVEAIERWYYKVFSASPPDLQNLLTLRDYYFNFKLEIE